MSKRMDLQLEAGKVKRWHTMPIIGEQTVADHTYGVCQILREITQDELSTELLLAALDHDVPEVITGDLPHTFKRDDKVISQELEEIEEGINQMYQLLGKYELSKEDRSLLKFADLAEMGYFALHQFNLGNRHSSEVLENVINGLYRILGDGTLPPKAREIYEGLCKAARGIDHVSKR